MEISISAFLLLALLSCTSATKNCTTEDSNDSTFQVIESDEASSQDFIDIGFIFGSSYNMSGKTVNLDGLIHLEYDKALVAKDTLIVVTKEDKVLPLLAFNEIRKPFNEIQLKDMLKEYKMLKSVECSEKENNVDGNYEIPYLFFFNECDSIQYMISSSTKKPDTYEFCEARFGKTAHNEIAQRVFEAISKINVDKIIDKYPNFKCIWFIQTDNTDIFKPEEQKFQWSLFIKLNNSQIDRILLTIDHDAILRHVYMSNYIDNI